MKKLELIKEIEKRSTKSKLNKDNGKYAIELLENIENGNTIIEKNLLNGASRWEK